MYNISIICVYNNRQQLEKQLLKSLNQQNCEFELILIDNTKNAYTSAAEALNEGVKQSKGDILIFSHQDITLKEKNGIFDFANAIDRTIDGDIVGSQGVRETSKTYYENLTCGAEYDFRKVYKYPCELMEMSCVDEGFFGMRRGTWELHSFNEILCDGWHLYCVEQCLYSRKNGKKVYVYPIQIHHYSRGTITKQYMDGLRRLCRHYRQDFKFVWTTCYKVRTSSIYINCLYYLWVINRCIRGRSL